MVSKLRENNACVLSMILLILCVIRDIISENHDEFVTLRHDTEFMEYIK